MQIIKKLTILFIIFCLNSIVSAAEENLRNENSAFAKGSTSVGIVAGTGNSFNESYIILGVGVGYYVLKGLELNIDVQHWFSGDPSITKVSPQIRYVFTQLEKFKPYIGAFYRRTFIEDMDDEDSFGTRAGAYFSTNNKVFIGAGIVYEKYNNCDQFVDCSYTYPELLITASF